MYIIKITRIHQDNTRTLGILELFKDGELLFECKTLELPWKDNQRSKSRIPNGYYSAIKHMAPEKGKSVWIQNVIGREEILIHIGNFIYDTRGCILLGTKFMHMNADGGLDLFDSAVAMNTLYDLLPDDEYFSVEIIHRFSRSIPTD